MSSEKKEQIKYIKESDATTRNEDGDYVIKNYITKLDNQDVSLAVSELKGGMFMTKNTKSDRFYYFLNADAEFKSENKIIKIEKNSVLFIPKNTKYKIEGVFKALLINNPAFDIKNEEDFI